MRLILSLLLLSSCYLSQENQPIASLQKKLEIASKKREEAEEKVAELKRTVQKQQLASIKKRIDKYEKQIGKMDPIQEDSFAQERETLHELIESSEFSADAQVELDRILRIITELKGNYVQSF